MNALPTGRRGGLLALGLTLLVLAALWIGVAAPLVERYADGAESLRQRRALARRMSELVATLPALRQQVHDSAADTPGPSAVLEAGSDAIASARLQELLQAMAEQAGIRLSRVETLPVEPRGAYARIGLRLGFATDWPALIQLLQAIEDATPQMLVDDLRVGTHRTAARRNAGLDRRQPVGVRLPPCREAGDWAMTRPGAIATSVLALSLLAVIAVEFGRSGDATADALPSDRPPRRAEPARGPQPPTRVEQWIATSLARPLFAPDRRPPAAGTVAATSGGPHLPRLAGTLVSTEGHRAIFAAEADGGRPLVVDEGGRVGPWTVRSIAPGEVMLSGPDGQRTIGPSFDRTAPAPEAGKPALPPASGAAGVAGINPSGAALPSGAGNGAAVRRTR